MTTTAARRDWAAVVSLGLGVFTITTTEIMPIGLLRPMADDLAVSEGTIGLTVTFFAFVAALSAPTLSTATRLLDRRPILLAVMAAFVVGNTLTALAVNYVMLVVVRMAIGMALGLMWAIVAATAVRLVPPNAAVRATTIAFSGVSLASVLGMPVGTVIGQAFGWRAAYWTLAGLSAVTLTALALLLRSVPGDSNTIGLRGLPGLLRMRDLRTTLIVTALVITGAYAAYTYVTPFIVEILGIDAELVGVVLLVMGVAGVTGNFAAGAFLNRTPSVRWSLATIIAVLAGALILTPVASLWLPAALVGLLVWAAGYAAAPIGLQTTVFRVAPAYRESATTLYSTTFNLSIGVGALLGALAIERGGALAPVIVGAVCATVALAVALTLPTRVRPDDPAAVPG
ncbi:MFS transporter [Gordonia aichiensis]|uniref:Putative major facilitator superfamily transporter n=1 Tax=Gordonia aichiensis NBRC 108223 TaxID=1220583 RepID=L7KNB5_9ACTN|nr:MFS transporter [Gordonia aichiensis]GAC49447.1 putative major facilitator superfamily transporter [Gordonia aichiensis NBRC 108223]